VDELTMVNMNINVEKYYGMGEAKMPEIGAAFYKPLPSRPAVGQSWRDTPGQPFEEARRSMNDIWKNQGVPFVMGTSYFNGKITWNS
jgi:hypothetical protein